MWLIDELVSCLWLVLSSGTRLSAWPCDEPTGLRGSQMVGPTHEKGVD